MHFTLIKSKTLIVFCICGRSDTLVGLFRIVAILLVLAELSKGKLPFATPLGKHSIAARIRNDYGA